MISFFFYWIPVQRSHAVRLSSENATTIAVLIVALTTVAILFEISTGAGLVTGAATAIALSWRCYRELRLALTA